jgi:hypothetical protein
MWTGSRLESEARTEKICIRMTPEELSAIEQFPGTRSDVIRQLLRVGIDSYGALMRQL